MANIKLKKTISPRVLSVPCKILRQVGVSETELAVGHTEVWREKADGQACVYESVTRTKTDTVSLCLHTHHKEWIDYRIERERERVNVWTIVAFFGQRSWRQLPNCQIIPHLSFSLLLFPTPHVYLLPSSHPLDPPLMSTIQRRQVLVWALINIVMFKGFLVGLSPVRRALKIQFTFSC